MGTFGDENAWKGQPDNIWQDGYDRLKIYDQLVIQEIANEQFGGDIIQAMQFRFKNNVGLALLGRLPKEWQIFSDEERRALAVTQQELRGDTPLREAVEDLLTGLDGIDEDTQLPPIQKNSGPQKPK